MITIAADVDPTDSLLQRLLHLSRLDDVTVITTRASRVPDAFTHITRAEFRPREPRDRENCDIALLVETGKGRHWYRIHLQHGWRGLASSLTGDAEDAEDLWLDLLAHKSMGNDVFVTINDELIRRRYRPGGVVTHTGVMTPREAVTTVEFVLRSRDVIVPIVAHADRVTVDLSTFPISEWSPGKRSH